MSLSTTEHDSNSLLWQCHASSKRLPSHRAPLERMKLIYELLANGTYPNALTIAAELEVSPATARRDLEFLRDRWGLPIAYDSKQYGYYLTEPVNACPPGAMSAAEMFAVRVACRALEQYQRPFNTAVGRLLARLNLEPSLCPEPASDVVSFRPFAPEDVGARVFDLLSRAIVHRRAVTFEYRKPGEVLRRIRRVHPYQLMAFENRWYLLANDVDLGEIRKFAVGRMYKARLLRNEKFDPPAGFDLEEYLRTSLGIMTGPDDYEIAIEMDPWLTDVLRGRRWHPSQVWIELPNGSSYLRLRLSCLGEIERWVLGWGSHATVLRPTALAERIANVAQALSTKYRWTKRA